MTEDSLNYISPEYKQEMGGKIQYKFTSWEQMEEELALISNSLLEVKAELSSLKTKSTPKKKRTPRKTTSRKKTAQTKKLK